MDPEDDEITMLRAVDASMGVHGVTGPANGMRFCVIKGQDDDEAGEREEFIKGLLEYDDFIKAKYSAEEKRGMLKSGEAIANEAGKPSYPIKDESDLMKAIKAVGRGGDDHNAIRKHVIKRAKALGLSDKIPDDWNANGSLKKSKVAKAADVEMPDDNGDPDSVPGSPAWESKDAEEGIQAGQMIAQAIKIVQAATLREQQEVEAGHNDDIEDVWTLQDVKCALECALKGVAAFAFHEEAEAGPMIKGLTDAGVSVEAISSTLEWLESHQPGAETTEFRKETSSMELTKEELAEMLASASATAADAAVAKALAGIEALNAPPTPEEIEQAKSVFAKAGLEVPAPASTGVTTTSDELPGGLPKEITDVLDPNVAKAIGEILGPVTAKNAELTELLAKALGQPAPGGPILSAPPAPLDGPRGGTFDKSQFEGLKNEILAADGAGNVAKSVELRQKLGQDILRQAFAARGYDDSPIRQMRMNAQSVPALQAAG